MAVSPYSSIPSDNQYLYGSSQAANNDYESNQPGSIFEKYSLDDEPATSMNPKDFIKGKKVNQKAVDKCVKEAEVSKSQAGRAKTEAANAKDGEKAAKKTPEEKAIMNAKKDLGKLSKQFGKLQKILPPDIAGEFGETNVMFAKTTKTFLKLAIESRKKFVKLEKEGLKLINKGIATLKAGMKTLKAGEIISNIGFALEVASWVMFGVALGLMSNPFTAPAGIALKAASVVTGKIAMGLCMAGLALMGVGFIMIKDGEKKVKKGEKKLNESDAEKKRFNKYMKSLQKVSKLALGLLNSIKGMIMSNLGGGMSQSSLALSGSSMDMSNPFGGGMPSMNMQGDMPPMGLQDAFSFDSNPSMESPSLETSSSQEDNLMAAGAARLSQEQKGEIRKMMTIFRKHMKKMMDELKKVKQVKGPCAPPQAA